MKNMDLVAENMDHEVAENESCPCVKAMADGDGDYIKKNTRIIAQRRQFSFSLVAYGRRFQHGEALQKISGWCH